MWSEDVERFGEDVIVDEAGVDGEEGHGQDDVSAAEKDVENLALRSHFFEPEVKFGWSW